MTLFDVCDVQILSSYWATGYSKLVPAKSLPHVRERYPHAYGVGDAPASYETDPETVLRYDPEARFRVTAGGQVVLGGRAGLNGDVRHPDGGTVFALADWASAVKFLRSVEVEPNPEYDGGPGSCRYRVREFVTA